MMRKVVLMVFIMMALTNQILAGINIVTNGSFEWDEEIAPVDQWNVPQRWYDVNLPVDQSERSLFGAQIKTGPAEWKSDGDYSLTIYSKGPDGENTPEFTKGDRASISKLIYLTDVLGEVNDIHFAIHLSSPDPDYPWTPEKRTALVLIDGIEAWDSNGLGSTHNQEYLNRKIIIDDVTGLNIDANPHILTLVLKVNMNGKPNMPYLVRWDNIRFDSHCSGHGYLRADISYDCCVDYNDVKLLAEQWLADDPAYRYDLYEDHQITSSDFAVLANSWMNTSIGQEDLLLAGDLNNDGIVDFRDYAIAVQDWGSEETFDYYDISMINNDWLERNWLYGLE